MTYLDEDEVNLRALEERQYTKWERETKNLILSMTNQEKKQALWNKLFPPVEQDLQTNIY